MHGRPKHNFLTKNGRWYVFFNIKNGIWWKKFGNIGGRCSHKNPCTAIAIRRRISNLTHANKAIMRRRIPTQPTAHLTPTATRCNIIAVVPTCTSLPPYTAIAPDQWKNPLAPQPSCSLRNQHIQFILRIAIRRKIRATAIRQRKQLQPQGHHQGHLYK